MTTGALPAAVTAARAAHQAYEELYRAEFPALAGYCLRLTGDEQAARNAAQEALTRLFARFRSVAHPRPWLYTVATNLCRDGWAKRTRDQDAARRVHVEMGSAALPGPDSTVRDAVDRLPARLRSAVLLHYYADLRIADVALALSVPEGTGQRHSRGAQPRCPAASHLRNGQRHMFTGQPDCEQDRDRVR